MDDYRAAELAAARKKYGTAFISYASLRDFLRDHGVVPPTQPTIRKWCRKGWMPAPYNIGSRHVAWREDELKSWIKKRNQAKPVRLYITEAAAA